MVLLELARVLAVWLLRLLLLLGLHNCELSLGAA